MPTRDAVRRRGVSLRWRLTGAFAVAMAVVLTGLGIFLYRSVSSELLASVDRDLGVRADALTSALAADPATPLEGGHRFVDPDEAFAQVLDARGQLLDSTVGVRDAPLVTPAEVASTTVPRFLIRPATARNDAQRLLAVPAAVAGQGRVIVVGQTLGDRQDALDQLLVVFAVLGPAALLVTSVAGWVVAGAALRPVERMRRRASELARTGGRAALPVPSTGDELTRLAETLNAMLDQMHGAVDREHRFVDDASHELRTPLAVLKAELDLALSRERSAAELLAAVQAASRETDRLVRLAEDLLVLARVREGGLPFRPHPTDVPALLRAAVTPVSDLAARQGRAVSVNAADLTARLDPERVRQAVHNLVENAWLHGAGPITVSATTVPDGILVDVHDEGPGLDGALGLAAFEPFRRGADGGPGNPAGTGLGLAIVQAVAEAHGGRTETYADATGAGVRLLLREPQRR